MRRLALLLLILLALAACGGGESTADPAARAVESYLTSKVAGDDDAIRAGLCSEMESVLERELRTFESVADARNEKTEPSPEPKDGKGEKDGKGDKEKPRILPSPKEGREIDKQDAEAVLDALERSEPTVQKELAKRRAGTRRAKKDW